MKTLKAYVGVFGNIGFCEKFPDTEEYAGCNDELKELVDEQPDIYDNLAAGFYEASFEWERCTGDHPDEACLVVSKLEPWAPSPNNENAPMGVNTKTKLVPPARDNLTC